MTLLRPGTWELQVSNLVCGATATSLSAGGYFDGTRFTGQFTTATCAGSVAGTAASGVWHGATESPECGSGTLTIAVNGRVAAVTATFG